jgi:mycothiol system anti-sigma-R factor
MEDCMDCIETIARLHLYIDHELSDDEVAIVQQHLTACPNCGCRFHFDISVKRLLHDCCAMERAPEHLREAVLRIAQTPPDQEVDLDPELEVRMRAELDDC